MDTEQHSLSLGGDTLTRLIFCAAAAILLCRAADRLDHCEALSFLEPYRPLLKENRLAVIGALTLLFYGVSLALLPREDTAKEGYTPCP